MLKAVIIRCIPSFCNRILKLSLLNKHDRIHMKRVHFFLFFLCLPLTIWCQKVFETKYPSIPRIDIHSHAGGDINSVKNYMNVRNWVKANGNINISHWVNLGNREHPIGSMDAIREVAENRMVFSFGNFEPNDLVNEFGENTIPQLKESGYFGYKLWFGPYERRFGHMLEDTLKYVDDTRLDKFFEAINKYDFPMTSLHIADPNGVYGDRTKWGEDPIEFWNQVRAFEDVLKNNPNVLVVAAHGAWLMVQDAQLDYLRYLLTSYPNLHMDLAATYQYYDRVNRDNLRDFIINFSDRILFGTDLGTIPDDSVERIAHSYMRCFEILETDNIVEGGFFGNTPLVGLALPEKTLEDIYYKNAIRLFSVLKVE